MIRCSFPILHVCDFIKLVAETRLRPRNTIQETASTREYSRPSQIDHVFAVTYSREIEEHEKPDIFGKWMVFRHFDELDDIWEKIRKAIASDELQGCIHGRCTTLKYDPTQEGPGPSTKSVICVYTEEHNIDDIGFKLIEMVKHDIKFKTEEATMNRRYTHAGHGKVSMKTIYWNNGKPSFECEDKPCYSTSPHKEDIWHCNVVTAPEPFCSEEVHGRWILYLEFLELTELWHYLKDMIEHKESRFGAIRMVCPPKRERKSPTELPEFHLYTSEKWYKAVGRKLIKLVEKDIDYERKPGGYRNMRGDVETLYWNEGEPDFESIRCKGITKNWRTGEDVM